MSKKRCTHSNVMHPTKKIALQEAARMQTELHDSFRVEVCENTGRGYHIRRAATPVSGGMSVSKHLLISFCTGGLWIPIWILMARSKK